MRILTAHNIDSIGFDESRLNPHATSFVDLALRVGLVLGLFVWVLAIWKLVDLLGLL